MYKRAFVILFVFNLQLINLGCEKPDDGLRNEASVDVRKMRISATHNMSVAIRLSDKINDITGFWDYTPKTSEESNFIQSTVPNQKVLSSITDAQIKLHTTLDNILNNKDFRICIQALSISTNTNLIVDEGAWNCTGWASKKGGPSGYATNPSSLNPNGYRLGIEVRDWPKATDDYVDFRLKIRAVYGSGNYSKWSTETPWASKGGGTTSWTLSDYVAHPQGFEIYLETSLKYIWDVCSVHTPCTAGMGDCDNDLECVDGLVCRQDVGNEYGYNLSIVDVCDMPQNGDVARDADSDSVSRQELSIDFSKRAITAEDIKMDFVNDLFTTSDRTLDFKNKFMADSENRMDFIQNKVNGITNRGKSVTADFNNNKIAVDGTILDLANNRFVNKEMELDFNSNVLMTTDRVGKQVYVDFGNDRIETGKISVDFNGKQFNSIKRNINWYSKTIESENVNVSVYGRWIKWQDIEIDWQNKTIKSSKMYVDFINGVDESVDGEAIVDFGSQTVKWNSMTFDFNKDAISSGVLNVDWPTGKIAWLEDDGNEYTVDFVNETHRMPGVEVNFQKRYLKGKAHTLDFTKDVYASNGVEMDFMNKTMISNGNNSLQINWNTDVVTSGDVSLDFSSDIVKGYGIKLDMAANIIKDEETTIDFGRNTVNKEYSYADFGRDRLVMDTIGVNMNDRTAWADDDNVMYFPNIEIGVEDIAPSRPSISEAIVIPGSREEMATNGPIEVTPLGNAGSVEISTDTLAPQITIMEEDQPIPVTVSVGRADGSLVIPYPVVAESLDIQDETPIITPADIQIPMSSVTQDLAAYWATYREDYVVIPTFSIAEQINIPGVGPESLPLEFSIPSQSIVTEIVFPNVNEDSRIVIPGELIKDQIMISSASDIEVPYKIVIPYTDVSEQLVIFWSTYEPGKIKIPSSTIADAMDIPETQRQDMPLDIQFSVGDGPLDINFPFLDTLRIEEEMRQMWTTVEQDTFAVSGAIIADQPAFEGVSRQDFPIQINIPIVDVIEQVYLPEKMYLSNKSKGIYINKINQTDTERLYKRSKNRSAPYTAVSDTMSMPIINIEKALHNMRLPLMDSQGYTTF